MTAGEGDEGAARGRRGTQSDGGREVEAGRTVAGAAVTLAIVTLAGGAGVAVGLVGLGTRRSPRQPPSAAATTTTTTTARVRVATSTGRVAWGLAGRMPTDRLLTR